MVGPEGAILFTHYGRSLTDMPGDCGAVYSLCDEVCELTRRAAQAHPSPSAPAPRPKPSLHSDETLTLPDLAGDLAGQPEEDAISRLFD